MKICLIEPGSPFLLDARVFPSLGLLQVGASLELAGHDVKVEDLNGIEDWQAVLDKTLIDSWDAFGISCTTPQYPQALNILERIKETVPSARVIIGGPHVTGSPDSATMFDCVVRGDGESAILDAIKPDAPKIIDQATNTVKGILSWLRPARHLIDMDSYKYALRGVKGTSILTEMGCPFSCGFCMGRALPYYRRVRVRNADDVVAELEHLQDRYGIGAVTDFSDEINLLNEPLLALCKKLKPLGMKFRAFIKANLFSDLQAEAMASAGFVECCSGVESGSDRILGVMNKQTTRKINKQFVDLCHKHGIRAKAFMSLGHPGENYESALALKDWLVWAQPDDFDVTVITVYPACPYWDDREFHGVSEDGRRVCRYVRKSLRPEENGATLFFEEVDYAKEFAWYKGRPKEYVSHVWTPDLSKEDLVRLRDSLEDDVRKDLKIPYPRRYSGDYLDGQESFDHSMGQGMSVQDSRTQILGLN